MRTIIISVLSLFVCCQAKSQYFPVDTAKLNASYQALLRQPNSIERQKAFFEAFPSNWGEFIGTYQYVPDKEYDLTMYRSANEHIEALKTKMTQINDLDYCKKLVNIAIGAQLEADAPNHFQDLLHDAMWRKMDGMLNAISKLRRGYQIQFWQFYWSNPVKSKSLETEYERLSKQISDTYPEETKMMEIAFKYFYDGVNIDGGYYN